MTKPALTAEQWKRELDEFFDDYGDLKGVRLNLVDDPMARLALAALCLKGQPFGFTWDDVELLRMFGCGDPQEHIRQECEALADRIEALLPPRAQ